MKNIQTFVRFIHFHELKQHKQEFGVKKCKISCLMYK